MKVKDKEPQEAEVVSSELPIEKRDFNFSEAEVIVLDEYMNKMRGNYMTIEELSRKNREHAEMMHVYIRSIHPDLEGVDYVYNPVSYKIQFRQKQ